MAITYTDPGTGAIWSSTATAAIKTDLDHLEADKQNAITGAATTITGSDLTVDRAVVSNGSGKVAVSSVTSTELGYVSGVTSAIQTQLDAKQATITGAATSIASSDLTVSRAVVSDGSGKVAVATTTATEIGYVNGVTSAIQTQIDGKAATSHTHAASDIASGTVATARLGSGTADSTTYLRGDQTWQTISGGISTTKVEEEFTGSTSTSITLSQTPDATYFAFMLFKNGMKLRAGAGKDFTRTGTSVSLLSSRLSDDIYEAIYHY